MQSIIVAGQMDGCLCWRHPLELCWWGQSWRGPKQTHRRLWLDLCFCCHPGHPSRYDWDIAFTASYMFIPEFGWGKLRNPPILSHIHFKNQWFVDVCYMPFHINQSFELGSTFSANPGLPCRRTGGSSIWRAGGIQMFSSWIEHGISWVSMHLMYYIICI